MSLPASCFNRTIVDSVTVPPYSDGDISLDLLNRTIVEDTLVFDGDIAGFGVRLSFYLQTLVLVLLVNQSLEDAPGALWTLTTTSCGLTVAAIVQVASQNLSLLEAILVSQLVWLANIASFIASASYSQAGGRDNFVKLATVGQGYLSMVLTIIMWRYADKLGRYPECNALIKFVLIFAIERPALGTGRTASLISASVILCGYTYLTLDELSKWWKSPRRFETHGPGTLPKKSTIQVFVGVVLVKFIIFSYFVCTTELIIKKTRVFQDANHKWGFGQVFALMVITPSVVALCKGMGRRNQDHRPQNRPVDGRPARRNSAAELGLSSPYSHPSPHLPIL